MSRAIMLTAIFLAGYAVLNVTATTYYVNASRTDDSGAGTSWGAAKKSIQAAINISAAGDTIIVTNGLYAPISTDNKAITIQSVNGAEVTVIDGAGENRCASLGTIPLQTKSILYGFTLQNGTASSGGGSYCGSLYNCTLSNNTASFGGGAYYSTLNNCMLSGNTATSNGGGAHSGSLYNCTLSNNTASSGGGVYISYGTLNNCILSGNTASSGGGSYGGTLNNCFIVGNVATNGGGAYYGGTGMALNNCTVVGNMARSSYGGVSYGTLNNCIVRDNALSSGFASDVCGRGIYVYTCAPELSAMNGCISDAPLFVDAAAGDYRLQSGSPCVDSGLNALSPARPDADGCIRIADGNGDGMATVDMGA